MSMVRNKYPQWSPQVRACSAGEDSGIEDVWQGIVRFTNVMAQSGGLAQLRQQQTVQWLQKQAEEAAVRQLFAHQAFRQAFNQTMEGVKNHHQAPRTGLQHLCEFLQHHYFEQ